MSAASTEATLNNCSLSEIFAQNGSRPGRGSNLPTPMSPAWYNPGERSWYSESDYHGCSTAVRKQLVPCSLFVEFSPTARAKCRRCGEPIPKDVLRFGYPFRFNERESAYSNYLHLDCYVPHVFGIKVGDPKSLGKELLGFHGLSNTEQAQVKRAMSGAGKRRCVPVEDDGVEAAEKLSAGGVGTAEQLKPQEAPRALAVPLLPFQKEGLAWMCRQEDLWERDPSPAGGNCRGGVLADEMGMGKTIQAVALLLARPRPEAPTLVVVPMAAVQQWVNEIARYTKKGALQVSVYHGSTRKATAKKFKEYDVVLTTYQTLENDYRREMDKVKVTCKYCGRKFLPEKLGVHQRYFCGPTAVRTLKQMKAQRKDKLAALKGMRTMGIGGGGGGGPGAASSSSSSSAYVPPTITNIYRETLAAAGVELKGRGYSAIIKEVSALNSQQQGATQAAGSKKALKSEDESLTRERLVVMTVPELQAMCEKRGLDFKRKKEELINSLSIYAMQKMGCKIKQEHAAPAAALSDLSKSDLIKMKLEDLQARATKMGLPKAEVKDYYKKDLIEYVDAKLTEKRAGTATKRKAAAIDEGGGKRKMKCAQPRGVASGGWARTVAGQRRQGQEQAAKGQPGKKGGKAAPPKAKGGRGAAPAVPGTGKRRGRPPSMVGRTDAGHDISGSPLHNFAWSRIILDEGHRIKGRTNSTATAAYGLRITKGGFRWCLTGTPLQNRVGELYSLVRYLEFRPYAYYYCKVKGCDCERCNFMRDRYCPSCGHNRMMHYSYFKSKISTPIIKYGYLGAGKEAFQKLQTGVLEKIMLRRTKEQKQADLGLPPLKVLIRKDKLSGPERDFYESLFRQSCVNFGTYVAQGTLLHNYAHIFDLLTSLRRAVDHPYLIVHGNQAARHAIAGRAPAPAKVADICGLCQDSIEEGGDGEDAKAVAKCGHTFHSACIQDYLRDAPKTASGCIGCPVCYHALSLVEENGAEEDDEDAEAPPKRGRAQRKASPKSVSLGAVCGTPTRRGRSAEAKVTPIKAPALPAPPAPRGARKPSSTASSILQRFKVDDFASSTKIEALVDEVSKMREADKKAKGLVFSQFGAMLELVEFRLKRAGFNCTMFRGGMSMQARSDAIASFNNDPSLTLILISLKAGGEGLNLQAASHVFLLDPWWNPACELQAIQRAHRIGQTREVRAVRFIMQGTVEEKIVQLQEKKQLVFDGTIGGSSSSIAKLTEQDLHFLFQH